MKAAHLDAFAEISDKTSKSFGYYGMIRRFPTTYRPGAAGNNVLDDHTNFLATWNQISLEVVLNNANMTWGDKSYTDIIPHEIEDMIQARDEVSGGVRGALNDEGKVLFLQRCQSTMLDHYYLAYMTEGDRRTIKTHVESYEYFNTTTGKTAYDGPTIFDLILQTIRSNVQVNVFRKISAIKEDTLSNCNNNVVE